MQRLRALAIGLGVVLGLAVPVAAAPGSPAGPTIACAADTGPRAVLVVDNGARVHRLCVALDGATVSGIHLVELASAQHGLQYALGFGKQAICQLDGVGVSGGDCFAEYPDFWGYWHGNGSGGWTWANGGAATYRVGDGDVEGWVWGSGDSGSTHRAPPTTRADDACPPVPSPEPPPSPNPAADPDPGPPAGQDGGGSGSGAADPSTPGTSASPTPHDRREAQKERQRDRERQREREREATPTPVTSATPADDAELRATGARLPDDADGPATGLLAALALGLGVGAAGWWRIRRTRHGEAP